MFPKVDIPTIYVSGKLDSNKNLEETNDIALEVSKILMDEKEHLGLKSISTLSGFRAIPSGQSEIGDNLFYIIAELKDLKPQNFVDEYITPYLSIDYDMETNPRDFENTEIIKVLNQKLSKLKNSYQMEDLAIFERRIGVKIDVEIAILAKNTEKIFYAIDKIESKLKEIKGLTSISNNAFLGLDEVKLQINRFGESLGITEKSLATSLSNLYLSNKKALSFDSENILDIVIEDIDKDNFERLKDSQIDIDGKKVFLRDIVNFITVKTLNSIDKRDFKQMKNVFVNVDSKIITANEVLEFIEPTLDELRAEGFKFKFFGEKERSDRLATDLKIATIVAIFSIFLALLYMFNSFRYSFMIISVIPFSILGVFIGHFIMGMNLTMPSIIGAFGLAGVVINDGIVMLDFLRKSISKDEILENASKRFRPIILTSLTTLIGLSTLIFFVSGQGKILQPIAISLGFGLAWGTILNLFYIPTLFSLYMKEKR
jgi:multidrug efflux pump subunit AcrB